MALKGKTKKSRRHRAKPVARPPKAAVAKRSPDRRRIDLMLVIGGLFALTLVVAIVWALAVGEKPKPVAGLDDYNKATAETITDLENVSAELADAATTVASAQPDADLTGSFARTDGLASRLQSASDVLAAQSPQGSWATAASVLQTSVKILREGVGVLALAEASAPQQMQAQMARKAARLAAASDALRGAAQRNLENIAAAKDFVEEASDFVQWPAPPGDVEAEPLLGILAELPAPPGGGDAVAVDATGEIDVVLETQPVAGYGTSVGAALTELDKSIGPMGEVVRATQTTQDYPALQLSATEWFQSTRTAYAAIGSGARPDRAGLADVALVNSLWLLQESARSFASTATDSGQSTDLIEDGQKLRLLSDELRRTATTNLATAGVTLAPGTDSGFDPTLIGPATPPAGAGATGATGAVPGPGAGLSPGIPTAPPGGP
ncbi:MAG: hypothetical protein K1X95_02565 [Acidimicrobiia bacterium]|nr:hypothetical protein [Acidimicrobiia bacterium]